MICTSHLITSDEVQYSYRIENDPNMTIIFHENKRFIKIRSYKYLADESLDCENPRKVMIVQSDKR